MFHEQRYACLRVAIQRNVDRIESRILEFELLNIHDEVSGAEMHVVRKSNFDWNGRKIGHDGMSIGIDEIQAQRMFALVAAKKGYAEGNGALGMNSG